MKCGRFTTIVFAALMLCVFFAPDAHAFAFLVDNSTSDEATASSDQRHSFYDTVNYRHWVFYYNGTQIEYSRSTDGQDWTSAGTLAYGTSDYSIVYKVISGTPYVFLVSHANTYDIIIRRGTLSATAITFDAEITVYNGTSITNRYANPTIALDSNNKVWVGAAHDKGNTYSAHFQARVIQSTNIATGNLSTWGTEKALGRYSSGIQDLILLSLESGNMYLVANSDSSNIVGYRFDGTNWIEANTGGNNAWFANPIARAATTSDIIYDAKIINDTLYIAGFFENWNGDPTADYIAYWDGQRWRGVGEGLNNVVFSIAYFNNQIYVGGGSENVGGDPDADYLLRWNGTAWEKVSSAVFDSVVSALEVDGSNLYVGGGFTNLDGNANADRIAVWDNSAWSNLGTGMATGYVSAITINGSDVYVGGDFTNAGGVADADNFAMWDGNWHDFGTPPDSTVNTISIDGTDIYIGGAFGNVGGVAAQYIARWDGGNWNAVGAGVVDNAISDIEVIDNDIYIAGTFTTANNVANTGRIAYWDGANWQAVGSGLSPDGQAAYKILPTDSGFYVGGSFTSAGGDSAGALFAEWTGAAWQGQGDGAFNGSVNAFAVIDDDIYIGGSFENLAGVPEADRIARWDIPSQSWHALGNGIDNGSVYAIAGNNDGLYIGGNFTNVDGNANADRIVLWDGNSWNNLDGGIGNNTVYTIAIHGANIYVGGDFTLVDGQATEEVARWNGTSWTPMLGIGNGGESVFSLIIFGNELHAGGLFLNASGDADADFIAKWNGAAWVALGTGTDQQVQTLTTDGTNLYVGGSFNSAGGVADTAKIARWNGSWHAIGDGLNGNVYTLSYDSGNLYAGGAFTDAGGNNDADSLAYWDGASWNAFDITFDQGPSAIFFNDSTMFVGGNFRSSDGSSFFSTYSLAIANDANLTSQISAIAASNGDIHLLYTNADSEVLYKSYDESADSWGTSITLDNSGNASDPSMSYDSYSNDLYAFWLDSGDPYYKKGVSPYAGGDWDAASNQMSNSGEGAHLSTQPRDAFSGILIFYTDGTSSPYDILSTVVGFGYTIEGTITDGTDPLENVDVVLNSPNAGNGSTTTDASGYYSFNSVPHLAVYTITASKTDYSFTGPETGAATANSTINFTGTFNSFTLSGTITYNNTPLANVTVALSGDVTGSTTTNGSGVFTFANIPAGTSYTLTPSLAGYVFSPKSGTVSANATRNFQAQVATYALTGTITRNGSPVSGATVHLGSNQTTTDSSGNYTFATVLSGSYTITAYLGSELLGSYSATVANGNQAGANVSAETFELSNVTYGLWNGYLEMQNILELANRSATELAATIEIYTLNGESSESELLSSSTVVVGAHSQLDTVLNALSDFTADSYGLVKVTTNHTDFDGRVSYYKQNSAATGDYDFAYSLPLSNTVSGDSYHIFNTNYPETASGESGNTWDWLAVTNLSGAEETFTVSYYSASGELISTQSLALPDKGRFDLQGGQDFGSAHKIGLIKISPSDPSSDYITSLSRYGQKPDGDYTYAFGTLGNAGKTNLYLPVSNLANGLNYIEIANTTNQEATATLTLHSIDGSIAGSTTFTLPALSQRHILADDYLSDETSGTAIISSSVANSLTAQSVNYYTNPDDRISSASVSSFITPQGTMLSTSYNLFLDSANWLRILSTKNEYQEIHLMLNPDTEEESDYTYLLAPYGRLELPLHESSFGLDADSYGYLRLMTNVVGGVESELLRAKTDENGTIDFATVTPVR